MADAHYSNLNTKDKVRIGRMLQDYFAGHALKNKPVEIDCMGFSRRKGESIVRGDHTSREITIL